MGYEFTANTAVSVDGLGTFAVDGFQLPTNEPVGLWDSGGNLLASTTLTTSDPVIVTPAGGSWVFAAITPVALTAGDSYYVGSVGPEAYAYGFYGFPGFTVAPSITYVQDAFGYGNYSVGTLSFPDATSSQPGFTGFFGGNVELSPSTVTPEPGSYAALILGFGGVMLVVRSRREKQRQ